MLICFATSLQITFNSLATVTLIYFMHAKAQLDRHLQQNVHLQLHKNQYI